VKNVCAALADWLAEQNLCQFRHDDERPRLQIVFPSDRDAWQAKRAFLASQPMLETIGQIDPFRIAGVRFEFVGPTIEVSR
jgi:hypothetical protein